MHFINKPNNYPFSFKGLTLPAESIQLMDKQEVTMLQIKDSLISLDVVERKFCCDLAKCKGACCIEGDSGAPLTEEETGILEREYQHIRPFMRAECVEAVQEQGTWVTDHENDKVTPLINGKECVYVFFEKDIAKCAIEKAYFEGKTFFRKPVSCHLYPIRLKKYASFEAVNFHEWGICKPARALGALQDLHVYRFLQEPLIRHYGKDWYDELEMAADSLLNPKL